MSQFSRRKNCYGFTTIEMLAVFLIIGVLSTVLFTNFRSFDRGVISRRRAASLVMTSVRKAQSLALAGSNAGGVRVCGFGVSYSNPNRYYIYGGVPAGGQNCGNANRNFQPGLDTVEETINLKDGKVEVAGPRGGRQFYDIFFESPDSRTYINNDYNLSGSTEIYLWMAGDRNCQSINCTTLRVYGSGRIEFLN